jgi:kynurenine formamidase
VKFKTLIFAYALAVAVFLFAQRSPEAYPAATMYKHVVDLTQTLNERSPNWEGTEQSPYQARELGNLKRDGYYSRRITLPEHHGTHIDAPAHFADNGWTVDRIPVDRLIAPLVVIDVREKVKKNPDYAVSMEDLAEWEKKHGHVPRGAVVLANTGWCCKYESQREYRNSDAKDLPHYPGFALETVKFLVENRDIVGLGIDTMSVDIGATTTYPVHQYTASRNVYHLENLGDLSTLPATGATIIAAPAKLQDGSGAPVRVLALVN